MNTRGFLTAFFAASSLLLPTGSFAANKEMQELQRDVALLQEDVRQLQRTLDKGLATQQTMIQQTLDTSNRTQSSMAVLERSVGDQVRGQVTTGMAPLAGLGTRIDQ